MSLKDGPGEGGWSVFAEKVVAERDKLLEENVALKAELETLSDEIELKRIAQKGTSDALDKMAEDRDALKAKLSKLAETLGYAENLPHMFIQTEVESLMRKVSELQAEVGVVDEMLARRPALDDISGRALKIEKAISVAKTADALKAERESLLDLLEGFVVQDCTTDHGYSSRAIGAYADGLRALIQAGRMEYVSTGTGRIVLAKRVRG